MGRIKNSRRLFLQCLFPVLFSFCERFIYLFHYFICMETKKTFKDPSKMTTEELIELADEMKSGITTEWIKRREAIKRESKPLLVQQS